MEILEPPAHCLIVEDHPLMRAGLSRLLGTCFPAARIHEAGNRLEALQSARLNRPDLVLLDVVLPDVNGIDLLRDLQGELPKACCVVITAREDASLAQRALDAGAAAYLSKEATSEELAAGVRAALRGERQEGRTTLARQAPSQFLSPRELSIFGLIGRGLTTRAIAANLGISIKTVEAHRENIKQKLQLTNGLQLSQQAALWVAQSAGSALHERRDASQGNLP